MAIKWKDSVYDLDWSALDADGRPTRKPRATYDGYVVDRVIEPGVRVMSDVWADLYCALVWTGSALAKVCYGSSEFGSDAVAVEVDATPEVLAAVEAYRAKVAAEVAARDEARRRAQVEYEARRVKRGRTVEVFKGRKVPVGTVGEVFWIGESRWGGYRVGIRDAAGTVHWTAESNCRVIAASAA